MANGQGEDRAADERLVRSRAIDSAPIGITLTDPSRADNPLVYVNEGFTRITGYEESEVLGRNCRFLQGPDTDEAAVAKLREAIDAEERVSVELVNYRKDGSRFWNAVDVAPVYDPDGELTNYLGFQRDVTERKERERDLARRATQFETFADVLSHDLRSPLNVVSGYLEVAADSGDTELIEKALDQLDRVFDLVDELTTVMREGRLVGDSEPIALAEAVEECWSVVETADASLTVASSAVIRADADALQRLLENLFRNAVEHGGPDVSVTVGLTADGFYVEDDGPGFPESERDRVFEPGYTTSEDGQGFGMASVQQIALAHGWEVSATEGTEGGARIEVTGVTFVEGG